MSVRSSQSDWGLQVDWLMHYLLDWGVSHSEITTALSRDIDSSPRHLFLPIDDYLLLFAWAADRLDNPHLGLDIAQQLQGYELGIYGYLAKNSATVGNFCDTVERYQPIFMRGMGFTCLTTAQQLEVRWKISRPDSDGVRQDIEFTLAAFLKILRLKLGDNLRPLRVNFRGTGAEPLEHYRQVFDSDIYFEQAGDSLIFSSDLLQLPLSDSDPNLLAILKEQADVLLQKWKSQHDLVEQVKFLISTSLEDEVRGLEMLANRLHTTTRTLNRRLTNEGTSFQKLREEVIEETAKRALAESDAPITVIAGKLGYSESSAFVRVFKRMTGTTPSAYRSRAHRSSS